MQGLHKTVDAGKNQVCPSLAVCLSARLPCGSYSTGCHEELGSHLGDDTLFNTWRREGHRPGTKIAFPRPQGEVAVPQRRDRLPSNRQPRAHSGRAAALLPLPASLPRGDRESSGWDTESVSFFFFFGLTGRRPSGRGALSASSRTWSGQGRRLSDATHRWRRSEPRSRCGSL